MAQSECAGGRLVGVWRVRWTSSHVENGSHGPGRKDEWAGKGDGGHQRCESAGECSTRSAVTCASDGASSALGPSADRPAAAQHPSELLIARDSPTLCKLLTY